MWDIPSDVLDLIKDPIALLRLVYLVLSHQLVDKLGCLFDISLAFLLERSELVFEQSDLVTASLWVLSSLLCQLFHRCEVLGPPLVLQLIDCKLNLSCSVLFQLDKLAMHIVLIDFLKRCLTKPLKQGIICLLTQAVNHLWLHIIDISWQLSDCRLNFSLQSS